MNLINHTIDYQYHDSDSYRVVFTQNKKGKTFAHWHVLTGTHSGDNRKEVADISEVAPNVWFVSWLEPTLEVVSFVANLNDNSITCSYYYNGERHWWAGTILAVSANLE